MSVLSESTIVTSLDIAPFYKDGQTILAPTIQSTTSVFRSGVLISANDHRGPIELPAQLEADIKAFIEARNAELANT